MVGEAMTEPLVASEVDLRDFPYMPLDVVRLRDSDLSACATGDEFKAAVILWCASWHQRPAASLPADDRILARLAGVSLPEWQELRAGALRGWVKCSDNRFYHPVVAEKAKEAWEAKERRKQRTAAARTAKLSQPNRAECNDSDAPSVTTPVTEIVTGSNRREGKGEEEKKDPTSLRSVDEPAQREKKYRAKSRTQIAEDAQPDERDRTEAERRGLSKDQFRLEWRKFRDHHRAKGSLMADWHAAWRKWLDGMANFQPAAAHIARSPPTAQQPTQSDVFLMAATEFEKRRNQQTHDLDSPDIAEFECIDGTLFDRSSA